MVTDINFNNIKSSVLIRLLRLEGVNLPRIASDGGPLPSARAVSAAATPDMDVPHNMFTLLTMQWGQFIDHDLTVTAITKSIFMKPIFTTEKD